MEKVKITLPGTANFFVEESYKFLRTNLQFCGPDIRVIAVTSCYENEGKTTVSLSLAKSFAELGKKTLLVDCDMRKSVLATQSVIGGKGQGLSEMLSGMVDNVNDIIYSTSVPNMYVLLAGQYPPNPVELLSGKLFASIIAACRNSFDYIILDTPPLGAVSDAAVIAPRCDGTLLVFGRRKLNRRIAVNVVEQLQKSGTPLLGVVRNDATSKKKERWFGAQQQSYYRGNYY